MTTTTTTTEGQGGELSLEVRLEPGCALRAGEPVWLLLALRNGEEGAVRVPELSSWFECQFDARGPGGELPRTRYGNEQYRQVGTTQTGERLLGPGEVWEKRVPVSRLFDTTVAGEYRVAVSRELRSGATGEWVALRSNELAFRLAE